MRCESKRSRMDIPLLPWPLISPALNCKRLILTHFSQRYKEPEACSSEEDKDSCVEKLLLEAKAALEDHNTMEIVLAKDLKDFTITSGS